jgi:hypothetical protein
MMCDTFLLAPHKNYVSPQQVIFNAGDTPHTNPAPEYSVPRGHFDVTEDTEALKLRMIASQRLNPELT